MNFLKPNGSDYNLFHSRNPAVDSQAARVFPGQLNLVGDQNFLAFLLDESFLCCCLFVISASLSFV
jgi:hypothetical protein